MNTVDAKIDGGSDIDAVGAIGIHAQDSTTVVVVAGGFAGSGKAAVGVAASTVYEENSITAQIDGSDVTSTGGSISVIAGIAPPATAADPSEIALGTSGITLPEFGGSQVVNLTFAGAGAGKLAVGAALSVNTINNTIAARITNASTILANGDVVLSAIDKSVIDALALGAAGSGGVGVGVAVSANVITNGISTVISGSTVTSSAGDVTLTATSSSIIRALGIGASGSGDVAVAVSALGNAVTNSVTSTISAATVKAADDVIIIAQDIAPSVLPAWMLSADKQAELDAALSGPRSISRPIFWPSMSVWPAPVRWLLVPH